MQLVTNFRAPRQLRSNTPLNDNEIMAVAPSIYAEAAHESRSSRYGYIPTVQVLDRLRREGFSPFMVAQSRSRDMNRRVHTKHMIRLRHASKIGGAETQEIILINSHDGTSSYQMLGGMFRFVCCNGLVCGDTTADVRIKHSGNVVDRVIEGAYEVLQGFERVEASMYAMKKITLTYGQSVAFATAALAVKYEDVQSAPITPLQVLSPRRYADDGKDLWSVFNRTQENLIRGGLRGRSRNGRRSITRAVSSIDGDVRINRALWVLADELRKIKAAA